MKNVFLIDIDGTLLKKGDRVINDSLISTINKLKEDGHIFVIATGRSLRSTKEVVGVENFDYFACLMGLIIYDNVKKMHIQNLNLLNSDNVDELIDYFVKNNRKWFYKDFYGDYTTTNDKEFNYHHNLEIVDIDRVKKDIKEKNIFQIYLEGELDTQIKEKFKNDFDFCAIPNGMDKINYDITAKNIDKGLIVKYFKQNFKDYQIVAIGDSNNDIGMLKVADVSVAMGNANEDIKNICDVVTLDCENDGVEVFLKNFTSNNIIL